MAAHEKQEISATFTQRELNVRQKAMIEDASAHFSEIEATLNMLPKSRLVSLALTEIEKTALVVNKAISRLHDEQEAR